MVLVLRIQTSYFQSGGKAGGVGAGGAWVFLIWIPPGHVGMDRESIEQERIHRKDLRIGVGSKAGYPRVATCLPTW